jgi:hypothetical protein
MSIHTNQFLTKKVQKMSPRPSEQEIQDHLQAFNRLCRSWTRNRQSADAKAKGLYNYEKWFQSHGITLSQDRNTHEWKVNSSSFEA